MKSIQPVSPASEIHGHFFGDVCGPPVSVESGQENSCVV